MNATEWHFHTPTQLRVGPGVSARLVEELLILGARRPLLVSDGVIAAAGLVDAVLEPVRAAGLEPVCFAEVEPNPSAGTVHRGLDLARDGGCDAVVGLGGGSPIDAAKAMAVLHAHRGPITDYEAGRREFSRPGLPLVTLPTTAGTGSEVTFWSVITDPETRRKFDVGSPLMAARTALVDPDLAVSLPPAITAATGMDAFTHALEAYTTAGRGPLTDGLALAAMEAIVVHLPRAVADGADREARSQMALAAATAGLAFPNAGLGAVHGLSAPLGGRLGAAHGAANAALLPAVMRYNATAVPERYARVAGFFGWRDGDSESGAAAAVAAVSALVRELGIPSVRELGVTVENVPDLAREALGPNSNCNANPRPVAEADAAAILRDALENG